MHARKETVKTAECMADLSGKYCTTDLLQNFEHEKYTLWKKQVSVLYFFPFFQLRLCWYIYLQKEKKRLLCYVIAYCLGALLFTRVDPFLCFHYCKGGQIASEGGAAAVCQGLGRASCRFVCLYICKAIRLNGSINFVLRLSIFIIIFFNFIQFCFCLFLRTVVQACSDRTAR